MMIFYFIASILIAASTFAARNKRMVNIIGGIFYALQIASLAYLLTGDRLGNVSGALFSFDELGVLFFALMVVVACVVYTHSMVYFREEPLNLYRRYFALLMLLTTAITGVYFANNIAVTWIFLEATTICSAGIIYHRHTTEALEATWKYLFVCSTGIAMAYLGILLLCSMGEHGALDYGSLREAVANGNPLYLKVAFMLILCGYSCKMEIFPLHTIGVDANFAAPAPAAAMISSALVNAGFIAIFRIYRLMSASEAFEWMRHVLIVVGILSLAIGALFLRRTNNYKRFLSYSTVENMGIALIGLGIGGIGVWAALFHVVCHTFIKSSLMLQIGVIHRLYGSSSINRIGNYFAVNKVGAIGILIGAVVVLAFPPSPLFISELMILKQVVIEGQWWLLATMLLLLCIVIYSICSRVMRLCYHHSQERVIDFKQRNLLSWAALALLIVAMAIGIWQADALCAVIDQIVKM